MAELRDNRDVIRLLLRPEKSSHTSMYDIVPYSTLYVPTQAALPALF